MIGLQDENFIDSCDILHEILIGFIALIPKTYYRRV